MVQKSWRKKTVQETEDWNPVNPQTNAGFQNVLGKDTSSINEAVSSGTIPSRWIESYRMCSKTGSIFWILKALPKNHCLVSTIVKVTPPLITVLHPVSVADISTFPRNQHKNIPRNQEILKYQQGRRVRGRWRPPHSPGKPDTRSQPGLHNIF